MDGLDIRRPGDDPSLVYRAYKGSTLEVLNTPRQLQELYNRVCEIPALSTVHEPSPWWTNVDLLPMGLLAKKTFSITFYSKFRTFRFLKSIQIGFLFVSDWL